jgi:hypothetical protein
MKLVQVNYDGVQVTAHMPEDLGDVCEHIATVKRGRFGVVTGHQSGVSNSKCESPTISDITFLTNPRYDRYLERMQAAVTAVQFVTFINGLPASLYDEMKAKDTKSLGLEAAFDAAKADILDSLKESQEGDGEDAHRMGHRLCYATYDAGDVPVRCHLLTEDDGTGHKRPIVDNQGLMVVESLMLPFFTVSRKVIDPGVWKPTNSRLHTLMKDNIRRATGLPEWKALSLGKGNFRTLTMDKTTVYGLVAEPLKVTVTAPQADFLSYIAGMVEGFWSAIEALAEVVTAHR